MCYAPPFSFPSENSILYDQNFIASEVSQARSLRGHSMVLQDLDHSSPFAVKRSKERTFA
jgi:hypothetical protein